VYRIIKESSPEYEPSCYLGGTIRVDSYKWLIGVMVGSKHGIYGSAGAKTMELAMAGHHLLYGTYPAYVPQLRATPLLFLLAPWDRGVRQAVKNRLADVLRHPGRLLDRIHVQTIGIIQAPDIQPNGQADMCDSCPDMTVWDGTLVNSCRMDEYRLFSGMLSVAEKAKPATLDQAESMGAKEGG
jgi:hypothetical protein